MIKSKVPAIWFADLTYTQQTVAADVIPAATASIAEYIESEVNDIRSSIFKYPEDLIESIQDNNLERPKIIFFSNYIWNCALSCEFAKTLRKLYPELKIIIGGPNYPLDLVSREQFLRERPFIDYYIRHEGEQVGLNLVKEILGKRELSSDPINGVDFIKDNNFIPGGEEPKIKDLSCLPSPYLSGKLDKFFDGRLLPIMQTNRGCPFTCSFCAEGTDYYSKVSFFPISRIQSEIGYISKKMEEVRKLGGRNDLFIADSNFGMYPRDLEICETIQESRESTGWPEYINVATGKNAKERVLKAATIIEGALRLSGSVQSLTPEVLKNIKRENIDVEALYELGLKSGETGANTYSEIIMCLPGETLESHFQTIKNVIESGFKVVHNFQLMILPGTPMHNPDYREKYGMNLAYRVLPRCYGDFEVMGNRIVCAEVETICTSTDSFSFDDYINARLMHLLIAVFYNDGVFGGVLNLLRGFDLSPFVWLREIYSIILDMENYGPFGDFISDTRNELWDSKEKLVQFTQDPSKIQLFISGELGNNLLFSHKSKLIFSQLNTLGNLAHSAAEGLLKKSPNAKENISKILNDIINYHVSVGSSLFDLDKTSSYLELSTDVESLIAYSESELSKRSFNLEDYIYNEPRMVLIGMNSDAHDLISRMQSIYGTDNVGTSRILSKVHLSRLFRRVITTHRSKEKTSQARMQAQGIGE